MVFAVLIAMLGNGCTDAQINALMFDTDLPIGLHVREQRNPDKYLKRQIAQARKKVTAGSPNEFVTDAHGKPYSQNQKNIRVALKKLGVQVRHDTFADRLFIDGLEGVGPLLDDRALDRLWLTIDSTFNFRANREFFFTVVIDDARRNAFHPVRDYLKGLMWDGQSRIDTWLVEYAGAEDTPYVRAVSAMFLIAAVRRILKPGTKFDEMLVLESPQGGDKSTGLQTLAVNPDWFSDDLPLNAEGKKVIESLLGHWIIEAAELTGMRRGEIEGLKAFLSRQIDRARMSYGRVVTEAPRQCVIFGTTNSRQYLRDNTGNRRFWPIAVKPFDIKALTRARDQLWAEAVVREADGMSIRLDPALYAAAEEQQQPAAG
jgi:predicted P-loop ATPase